MGGTGGRLDLTTNDGKSFTIPVEEDVFMGAVNVPFRTLSKQDLGTFLTTLVDKFIEARFPKDAAKKRLFEVGPNNEKMTIEQVLKKDPLDKIVVSSRGQVKYNEQNRPYLNDMVLPAYVTQVDIMSSLANKVTERFKQAGLGDLVNAEKLKNKGIIINDAMASVIGLAHKLETESGKPLTPETPPVVLLDVGSGIATGGIDGHILYTGEGQNARVWLKPAFDDKTFVASKVMPESFEESGALRGITYQTIDVLKNMSIAKRLSHPIYKKIKAAATASSSKGNGETKNMDVFDTSFEKTPTLILKDSAWKNGWVNQQEVFKLYFENPTDNLSQTVMNRFYDGLAALASVQLLGHLAKKVYLQCIDYENALDKVNEKRKAAGGVALANPLAMEINQRLWAKYLDRGIAQVNTDQNAVELVTLRNNTGTGYLAYKFKPDSKASWVLNGIDEKRLRDLH